jgi:hypothetical protein
MPQEHDREQAATTIAIFLNNLNRENLINGEEMNVLLSALGMLMSEANFLLMCQKGVVDFAKDMSASLRFGR